MADEDAAREGFLREQQAKAKAYLGQFLKERLDPLSTLPPGVPADGDVRMMGLRVRELDEVLGAFANRDVITFEQAEEATGWLAAAPTLFAKGDHEATAAALEEFGRLVESWRFAGLDFRRDAKMTNEDAAREEFLRRQQAKAKAYLGQFLKERLLDPLSTLPPGVPADGDRQMMELRIRELDEVLMAFADLDTITFKQAEEATGWLAPALLLFAEGDHMGTAAALAEFAKLVDSWGFAGLDFRGDA